MSRAIVCPRLFKEVVLIIALLSIAFLSVQAQTPPKGASPPKSASNRSNTKSPNVKTGEITALDIKKKTVSIKDSAGTTASYTLIEKSHYYRNKREAEPPEFKIGESVVVHIRHSRSNGEAQVIELTDKVSWDWLDGIRHSTTAARIQEIDEDTLTVAIGTEALPLSFTISDKTLWRKGGKEAKPTDFKAGESISIVPRSLPSGGIMASVVADTPQDAAQGKERKATSVHGVIQSLDTGMHTLTLKTDAGDTRTLAYTDATEVHLNSKTLPLTSLKIGQSVGVRIRRDDEKEIVWSITVASSGRSKTNSKSSGANGKPPP